ncbi:toll/interleukin-1 receptor (TIR) domain-containing protein [Artemisia annua]|uniref:Toll/interleukin-1 receptor (TIR) domain-containing protein n=1 Tax=Artemisia annua TaxID=35608 RepID=A0A2U1PQ06_ARTAN|nr:toll/interleukin-1 receptor (TIR) domain-containing protein [Artemisia annua]
MASSSNSSAPEIMVSSSTSSIQKRFKYDVFLSFRGEDTRKNFVDHLYHALKDKGIYTYKDDEKIQKGKRISTSGGYDAIWGNLLRLQPCRVQRNPASKESADIQRRNKFTIARSTERELYTGILEELEMKVLSATRVTAVSSKTQSLLELKFLT